MQVYPFGSAETRLVRESQYGTTPGSPTWKRLNGIGLVVGPSFVKNPIRIPGASIPTGHTVDDDFAQGTYQGRIDYNGIVYVLASLFGQPVITALGGSPAAYQWVFPAWNGRRPNRPISYAAFYGWPDKAMSCNGLIFNTMKIGGGRPDGFEVSGEVFAKAVTAGQQMGGITLERQTVTITGTPTGGTFTLTWNGETTATIAHNATAAAVQTALEGLSQIDPGDVIVGGGPGPGTPYTVDFTGIYAGQNVNAMTAAHTFTGGTSPNVAVTTTTPGADAVSDVPLVPGGAVQGNGYLDTTWAGLGTTQQLYLYKSELNITERMGRVMPTNKSLSSDGVTSMAEQDHSLAWTLGQNATLDAQLANLRGATKVMARSEWEGDTISGANKYRMRIDTALDWSEMGEPENAQEALARKLMGALVIDQVSGNAIAVEVINAIASL